MGKDLHYTMAWHTSTPVGNHGQMRPAFAPSIGDEALPRRYSLRDRSAASLSVIGLQLLSQLRTSSVFWPE